MGSWKSCPQKPDVGLETLKTILNCLIMAEFLVILKHVVPNDRIVSSDLLFDRLYFPEIVFRKTVYYIPYNICLHCIHSCTPILHGPYKMGRIIGAIKYGS